VPRGRGRGGPRAGRTGRRGRSALLDAGAQVAVDFTRPDAVLEIRDRHEHVKVVDSLNLLQRRLDPR
jgi:hypothetical protein